MKDDIRAAVESLDLQELAELMSSCMAGVFLLNFPPMAAKELLEGEVEKEIEGVRRRRLENLRMILAAAKSEPEARGLIVVNTSNVLAWVLRKKMKDFGLSPAEADIGILTMDEDDRQRERQLMSMALRNTILAIGEMIAPANKKWEEMIQRLSACRTSEDIFAIVKEEGAERGVIVIVPKFSRAPDDFTRG